MPSLASAAPELVRALIFGSRNLVCETPNAPGTNYTVVHHSAGNATVAASLAYDDVRGWGYEITRPGNTTRNGFGQFGPFDDSPNNRNVFTNNCPEEIYDSFIGAKDFAAPCNQGLVGNVLDPCTPDNVPGYIQDGIIFKVKVPNGRYRFVAAVGSADNRHTSRILAENGGSGPPDQITLDHVVLVNNYNQGEWGAGVFARVGFGCFLPPTATGPRFVNIDEDGLETNEPPSSPILEVTEGFIRIHQLQANSNAGTAGTGDPNGGNMVVLELWRVEEDIAPPPFVVRTVDPNPYAPGNTVSVTLDARGISDATTIEETIPAGWTLTDNGGGMLDGNILKFTATTSRTFTYRLTAPKDIDLVFSGRILANLQFCPSFNSTTAGTTVLDRSVPVPEIVDGAIALDLGIPILPGSQEQVSANPRNINVWAAGADIWGVADEGRFISFGEFDIFDIRCVVAGLDNTHPWGKAGLMARANAADPGSAYAFVHITPGNGNDFQYRDSAGVNAANRGQTGAANLFREVRLMHRQGNLIEAFMRRPGEPRWRFLGSRDMPSLALASVGLALTSHNINAVAGAKFQDVVINEDPPAPLGPVTNLACTINAGGAVTLSFTPPAGAGAIDILRNNVVIATLPGTANSYTENNPVTGNTSFQVAAFDATGLSGPTVNCNVSPCTVNPQHPNAVMVNAFIFGSRDLGCPTRNDPGVLYTTVFHGTTADLAYDPIRGWGYEITRPGDATRAGFGQFGPFDDSPNNRGKFPDTCPEQIYDSFIGAKDFATVCSAAQVGNTTDPCTAAAIVPDGIIFRIDVDPGQYRFVGAFGEADNTHAHRILAEDGGEGPPDLIGPNHVVLVSNHDQAQFALNDIDARLGEGVFARVGFDGKIPPLGDGVSPDPKFVDMDNEGLPTDGCANSPILEVNEGYIRIHQLQANSNDGPGGTRDPNGGDAVVLEIWQVGDVSPPPLPPTGLAAAARDGQVDLSWTAPAGVPGIIGYNVYQTSPGARRKLNAAPTAATSFTVGGLTNGTEHCFVVRTVGAGSLESADSSQACATPRSAGVAFKRGDVDANGAVEITDPINLLGFLFLGEVQPPCFDSSDADDNGSLEITDAIVSLGFQFLGEAPPPAPGPFTCGADPTAELPGADFGCVYPAASCQ